MAKRSAHRGLRFLLVLFGLICLAAPAILWKVIRNRSTHALPSWSHSTLAQLQQASRKQVRNPQVFYYLGARLQETGQFIPATGAYFHAVELNPEYRDAWTAWSHLAARVLGMQQSYDTLKSYLSQHPDSSEGHLMLALLIHRSGYEQSAYNEASLAVKANPRNASAWQVMGIIASGMRRNADAVQDFRQAAQFDPKDWRNHLGLGMALLDAGQKPEALAELRQAARAAPENGEAHLALGRGMLSSAATPADYDAARRELQQAVELKATLSPASLFDACLSLGESYESQSQWSGAKPWLESAATLYPESAEVAQDLAKVYLKLGDRANSNRALQQYQTIVSYQHTVESLTNRIASNRNDLQTRLKLARLYKQHGDVPDAIKAYSFLLMRAPGMEEARKELQDLKDRTDRPKR